MKEGLIQPLIKFTVSTRDQLSSVELRTGKSSLWPPASHPASASEIIKNNLDLGPMLH